MQLSKLNLALTRIGKAPFTPKSLFSTGAQGVFYDVSDYKNVCFEDSAGTISITSPLEKPVGLMLDKSKGATTPFGPELVTNGNFSTNTDGWTATNASLSVASGHLVVTNSSAAFGGASQAISVTTGKTYTVSGVNLGGGTGAGNANIGSTLNGAQYGNIGGSQSWAQTFVATGPTVYISLRCVEAIAGRTSIFDTISLKEWTGNHAYQSTTTSRPTLSARYNLLTKTEQFDDAAWIVGAGASYLSTVSFSGYSSGKRFQDSAGASDIYFLQRYTYVTNINYTYSVIVKFDDGNAPVFGSSTGNSAQNSFILVINGAVVDPTTYSAVLVSAGVYRVSCTANSGGGSALNTGVYKYATNQQRSFVTTGWDLRVANDGVGLPSYQRVDTATDYDYAGFPPYLKFDGTDDSMATGNIDFSATDRMSVFAGVRKLSDAAIGCVVELSAIATSNNGSFALLSSYSGSTQGQFWGTIFTGTGGSSGWISANATAPITNVLTEINSISGDSAILRVNGSQAASSTADQGTGNFGNYPLYIGRRGGSSLPFNGRIYSLVVVGKTASATQIANTENWIEAKTFGKDMNYVYTDEVLTAASEQITTADGQNVYMTVTYQ